MCGKKTDKQTNNQNKTSDNLLCGTEKINKLKHNYSSSSVIIYYINMFL